MTPTEFTIWVRGYLHGRNNLSSSEIDALREVAQEVELIGMPRQMPISPNRLRLSLKKAIIEHLKGRPSTTPDLIAAFPEYAKGSIESELSRLHTAHFLMSVDGLWRVRV
jgi:hypothetical protein